MNNPLISIITITFNAAEVVRPTMKSVKEQNFTDFEHLIIDGASSDNTLAVVRQAGRKEVRILSEPDRGIYDAMNKGLRMAKGKYVLFLNAGDTFHAPDSLMLFAKAAEMNPDIVYGDTIIVDADRKFISPRHLSAPEILTFRSFEKGMLVCHQAFMVRKVLAPAYDTSYRFSADYDWCVRCLKNTDPGKCINLRTVVIDYLADGTTDKNKIASLKERFRIMSKHYGFFTTLANHFSFITRALKRKKL
ncbi:MAG: glycosyltransferase [Muribaculaceae bacterium]|nr:glycosyltransferase [Muribaculaceae bacterium]